ncbi:actin [Orchesella cincta]|uniref:Actin n=1 Tax=Orchesella cincta TaxID=48709 RepID=A0A1D2NK87_ORCCI|nr:actin [Orchesella cincta]
MNILSGNRKKGTFWNAWRKKFYVVASGKLNGYEKDDCQELFQSINLIGGKVDFLDPVEFVGPEHGKGMTNRIIGVDDGKGHYFVLQCSTPEVAKSWVAALVHETESTLSFAVPILPKSPSLYRDIVLVDIGSSNVRAGVLTHQPTLPALFFASVMSENINSGRMVYGNDVYKPEYRKNAKITFPFECTSKMCQNMIEIPAIQGFLEKIFRDLKIRPENYRLILNLPRRVDNKCRQSLLDLLFNTFQVRSVLIAHQSVVSFWAYCTDNGIICDVGERCDIVPVSQGFILTQAWSRAPYGGQPLKHSLRQGLGPQENGLYLSTPAENLILRFISENFLCVSSNGFRRPSQDSQEIVVEMDLRDVLSFSSLIGVNQNVLRGVGEGFFDPGLYGFDCDSLPKMIYKCLQNCGVDIRKEMSQNILLVGGCTMIPGFPERLEHELTKLCPPHLKPKINVSPYRYHASFIGASVLASTEAFEKSLLHRSKYDGGPGPSYWMI